MTIRSATGLDASRAGAAHGRYPDAEVERTSVTGPNQRPSHPTRSEIRTIARRLQQASDTMGIHITSAFAERMATEGLRRSGQVGMVKTPDTVIFFAESADRTGVTILGWADQHTYLDRFASLQLMVDPTATASLDTGATDSTVPEL